MQKSINESIENAVLLFKFWIFLFFSLLEPPDSFDRTPPPLSSSPSPSPPSLPPSNVNVYRLRISSPLRIKITPWSKDVMLLEPFTSMLASILVGPWCPVPTVQSDPPPHTHTPSQGNQSFRVEASASSSTSFCRPPRSPRLLLRICRALLPLTHTSVVFRASFSAYPFITFFCPP